MSQANTTEVQELQILVGGERLSAAGGETFDALNPATGQLIARVPRCGTEDIAAAVGAASSAYPGSTNSPMR